VPCDNEFEKEFAKFLQSAGDVERFAKLPPQFGFVIEYADNMSNLRYYEPDFVAITADGCHHLIETKGLEDTNVANKDRAAQLWCENVTHLTNVSWDYLKVPQKEYEQLRPTTFEELIVLAPANLL
jgi:type III restriction enzyme